MRYKVIGVHPYDGYSKRPEFKKFKNKILTEEEIKNLNRRDSSYCEESLRNTYSGEIIITRNKKILKFFFFALILKEMK